MKKGRTTVYNGGLTTPEKIERVNPENKELVNDFLDYLESIGRAPTTIRNYRADLMVFFCWCLEELDNKRFVDITKREIARFQNNALKTWGWSPNRIRTVKATISSLGNYIEAILDEEYKGYRSIVRKVESPPKQTVRDKTTWTEDEIITLLNRLIEEEDYEKACFVALAAYSGRRKSELCRFRVSDFGEDKLVCGGALYKSDPIKTKGRGGGKYINCYTLAKRFKPYLDLWMKYRSDNGIVSEWLFPNHSDPAQQLNTYTIDSWTNMLSKLSGKPVYMHSLRHAYTTMLVLAGLPDNVIQTLVSWESAEMVRLYDDTPKDDLISSYFADGDIIKELKPKGIGDI